MTVYMAVTPDKYELPLIVSPQARVVGEYAGISASTVRSAIHQGNTGKNSGIKYVKVDIEEDEEEVKHGKAPTVKQKKLISAHGLRHETWLVERETNIEMVIVSRSGKSKRTLKKG